MPRTEFNKVVQITALLVFAIFGFIIWCYDANALSKDGLHAVSSAVTLTVAIWGVFIKWGWRWPVLGALFNRPNLRGTWIGQFNTDWRDASGIRPAKAQFVAVIRQTFLTIHVTTHTEKFVGHSYNESLVLSLERGEKQLVYLYTQDPISIGLPSNREGVAQFRVGGPQGAEMTGRYWSNQKTTGFIVLRKVDVNPLDSYGEAIRKWPMGKEEWNVELPELP